MVIGLAIGLLMPALGALTLPYKATELFALDTRPAVAALPAETNDVPVADVRLLRHTRPKAPQATPTKEPSTAKATPSTSPTSAVAPSPAPLSRDELLIQTLLYGSFGLLGMVVLLLIVGAFLRRRR